MPSLLVSSTSGSLHGKGERQPKSKQNTATWAASPSGKGCVGTALGERDPTLPLQHLPPHCIIHFPSVPPDKLKHAA